MGQRSIWLIFNFLQPSDSLVPVVDRFILDARWIYRIGARRDVPISSQAMTDDIQLRLSEPRVSALTHSELLDTVQRAVALLPTDELKALAPRLLAGLAKSHNNVHYYVFYIIVYYSYISRLQSTAPFMVITPSSPSSTLPLSSFTFPPMAYFAIF